jgi:branched-chain amino acid transport system permease protein
VNRTYVYLLVVGAALVYVYGAVGPGYAVTQATFVILAVLGASGLNIITGYSGQAFIGNAGFLAIGAMVGYVCSRIHAAFPLAMVLGLAVGWVIGLLLGVLSLRWRGFYLVIATLAFQSIVVFAMLQYQDSHVDTLSGFMLAPARLFGYTISGDRPWYYLSATIVIVSLVCVWNLARGTWGRGWKAIRANEEAAAVAGIPVLRYKVMAVAIGSGLISLQGVLQAYFIGTVSSTDFTIALAVSYVAMVIIGGAGTVAGPIIGAIVVTEVPYVISLVAGAGSGNLPYWQTIAYGLLVLMFLVAEPGGIVRLITNAADAAKRISKRKIKPVTAAASAGSTVGSNRG